jgi:hypothetical protein
MKGERAAMSNQASDEAALRGVDRSKTEIAVVFFFFCALAVVYSWPLALHLLDSIPYGYDTNPLYATARLYEGDHLQYYYHMGLLKHAATGHIPWFSNPLEFAAEHHSDRMFTYALPLTLLYLPVALFSMPLAYNLFLILAFGLSGASMYLWGGWLTGSRAGGLMAAFIFNFFPIRLVEIFGGHPSGYVTFLFPLTLYYFDRAVARQSVKDGVIAGALMALGAVQSYLYHSYYLLMFLMAYIPWRALPALWSRSLEGVRENIRRIAVIGTPFVLGIGASLWWMVFIKRMIARSTFSTTGRTVGEVGLLSPPLAAMWDTSHGWQVYAGVAMAGAVFGLVYGALAFRRREPAKWDILFFTAAFAGSYILAFGFTLNRYVPLYSVFYKHFPYFNLSRNPDKIMIIAMPMLSLLGGYMVAWLVRDGARRKWGAVVAVGFALAVAVNFHPKKAVGLCMLDEGNEVYAFLAAQSRGKPILNLPVWPGESSWESIYEYYAVQSGIPMINGYSPVVENDHIEKVFWPLFPMNSGDVAESQHKRLKELGVGFVVFHADAFPAKVSSYSPYFTLARLRRSPYLSLVKEADPLWVFAVRDKVADAPVPNVASQMGLLFQMESQPNIKGKTVKDPQAANGFALAGIGAVPPEGGDLLNAGPYVTLPSGRYAVTFRMKVSDNAGGPLVKLDVAAREGKTILAVRELAGADFPKAGEYKDVTVEFSLEPGAPWQVEFRAYRLGAPEVFVDNAYLRFAETSDPKCHFDAEELFYYSGRLVKDAQGKGAIRSIPGQNPADVMVFGPGRIYEPGRYRANVHVAVGDAQAEGSAGRIEVIAGNRREKLATTNIPASHAKPGDGFTEAGVEFTLTQRDTVEVRVYFGGTAPLTVDYIEINPATVKTGASIINPQ